MLLRPSASCRMSWDDDGLTPAATADHAEGLARVQDVVGRHLARFGAKEQLAVVWG